MRSCGPISRRCCAICGSTQDLQEHHLGGRNHAPYFTLPLCGSHHRRVTRAIEAAGAHTMFETTDREEKLRRARLAGLVFLWFIDESVKEDPRT